ncbi:PREDICTED: RING finger protein 121-like [Habropoda laboriosa]|uniref:RING finger protein 121-like n=1 Tax=Habropoda laboriosa TaxID=597456 RepID=UPI00083D659A|nr:PREDICTED: RING finger protein 121-like [Habropoda laboriosa]
MAVYAVAIALAISAAIALYFIYDEYSTGPVNNHPHRHNYYQSPDQQSFDDSEDICSICCMPLVIENTFKLNCHHLFHKKCIEKFVQHAQKRLVPQVCPLCRQPFKF